MKIVRPKVEEWIPNKCEVLKQEDIKDVYGHAIGIAIISRCSNCGKIKTSYVYTVNGRP